MIIDSIELENIRSYKHAKIKFNDSINFLSGDIGCGKSSILLACEFCLFGFKKGQIDGFDLVRQGEFKSCVKLTLKDLKNQKKIIITRNLKKSKKNLTISQENGSIFIDNNLLELSPNQLNSYIFDILNFPKDFILKDKNLIYRFTIYTAQEQLKEVLFTNSDKRFELIRKIFQIDKYKQINESILIYLDKLRVDKKIFNLKLEPLKSLEDEKKDYENQIKDLKIKEDLFLKKEETQNNYLKKINILIKKQEKELEILNNQLIEKEKEKVFFIQLKENLKKLEKELLEKENQKKEFESFNLNDYDFLNFEKEKERIKNKISKINLENVFYEKEINLLDNLEKEKVKFLNLKLELQTKKEKKSDLEKSFDLILTECKIKDLENKISKLELEKEKKIKIENQILEVENQILEINFNLKSIENKKIELKNQEEKHEKLEFCSNCLQKVDVIHKKKILKNLKEELLKIQLEEKDLIFKKNKKTKKQNELIKKDNLLKLRIEDLIKFEQELKNLNFIETKEKELEKNSQKLEKEINLLEKEKIDINLENIQIKLKKINEFSKKFLENNSLKLEFEKQISKKEIEQIKLKNLKEKQKINNKEIEKINFEINNLNENLKKEEKQTKIYTNIKNSIIEKKQKQTKFNLNKEKVYENLKKINSNLKIFESKIKNHQNKIKQINQTKINLLKIEKKLQNLQKNETFLKNNATNILSNIERTLFTKYYVEFDEKFQYYFKKLIEDGQIDLMLDEEFSPKIEQNGFDLEIKNLSGGEKSSLAIAYRLALKEVIENNLEKKQKLSVLILDEPTDGFSNNQILKLGQILKNLNSKQIILVSHDNQIESICDNHIKIEKENHKSLIIN